MYISQTCTPYTGNHIINKPHSSLWLGQAVHARHSIVIQNTVVRSGCACVPQYCYSKHSGYVRLCMHATVLLFKTQWLGQAVHARHAQHCYSKHNTQYATMHRDSTSTITHTRTHTHTHTHTHNTAHTFIDNITQKTQRRVKCSRV